MNFIKYMMICCLLVMTCSCSSNLTKSQSRVTKPQTTEKFPCEVSNEFFMAVLTKNESRILELIVPHPQASILWSGQTLTKREIAEARDTLKHQTCRELHAGDTYRLTGKEEIIVNSNESNATSKVIAFEIFGQILRVEYWVLKNNQWKIDATRIIASRLKFEQKLNRH